MAEAFSAQGVGSSSFEVTRDNEDVLLPANTTRLLEDMKSGRLLAGWSGIPCASWSLARRGPADYSGYPPPLRDSTPAGI